MSIVVRRAVEADAPALASLNAQVQSLHADALPDLFKPPAEDSIFKAVTSFLRDERNIVFIAETDATPVGYAYAEVVRRQETPFRRAQEMIYLHHLGVRPGSRRQGAGTALLHAIRSAGKELNIQTIALDVWAFNDSARRFFHRCGFSPYNERLWSR